MSTGNQEKNTTSKELLRVVREINEQLEMLPIPAHKRALEALLVMGNHRVDCEAMERAQIQRQAELSQAFGSGLITQ
jgi:hypothetical protein